MPRKAAYEVLNLCAISTHPLVLEDFARLLPGPKFRFEARLLEAREAAKLSRNAIPPARIYVVDAHGPRALAESVLAALAEFYPAARLVMVAARFSEAAAFSALRLGARGLLTYEEARAQLPRALESVAAGGLWVPRALLSRFVDSVLKQPSEASRAMRPANLSRREQEVFDALLENLANKEIAARLNISERTVKFHVSNVLAKFGVRRRADLIVHFVQGRS